MTSGRVSDTTVARALLNAGIQPFYRPDVTRIAETIDIGQKRTLDLGPVKKARRMIPSAARRRNKDIVDDFCAFMEGRSRRYTRVWNMRPIEGKILIGDLQQGVARFNRAIGSALDYLRKRYSIDVFLVAIQIKMNENYTAFDVHAHMICDVSGANGRGEDEDAIREYLSDRFASFWGPRDRLKNSRKAAAYIKDGLYHHASIPNWPDEALRAAWSLSGTRSRLIRPSGAFADWRAKASSVRAQSEHGPDPSKSGQKARYDASTGSPVYSTHLCIAGVLRPCLVRFRATSAPRRPSESKEATFFARSRECIPARARATSPAKLVATTPESALQSNVPAPTSRRFRHKWWDEAWPYGRPDYVPRPIRSRLKRLYKS